MEDEVHVAVSSFKANVVLTSPAKEMAPEAAERCEYRSQEEARRAVVILRQREVPGERDPTAG